MQRIQTPSVTRVVGALLLTLIAVTTGGCASYRAKSLPEVEVLPNPVQSKIDTGDGEKLDGLTVGAEFPTNEFEVQAVLDRDLLGCNVLPVYVYLRSTADDVDFEVNPADIQLFYNNTTELEQIDPEEAYRLCRFSHWRALPGYFLLPIIAPIFSHSFIAGANGRMKEDFYDKRLGKKQLIRGHESSKQGVVGVLFFTDPDGIDTDRLRNSGELKIPFTRYEGSTGDPDTLEIVFSF